MKYGWLRNYKKKRPEKLVQYCSSSKDEYNIEIPKEENYIHHVTTWFSTKKQL